MTDNDHALGDAIAKAARDDLDNRQRGKIEVPEWKVDGKPTTIWFKPMTMAQIFDLAAYKPDSPEAYRFAHAIVMMAEDENGNRMFTLEHERTFTHMSAGTVVRRIAQAILSGPTLEEAEKN